MESCILGQVLDGNKAESLLNQLLQPVSDVSVNYHGKGGSYMNLLCAHPPFQIDGNLGGTAAIVEMLLQSHGDRIRILPAIPDTWADGSVTGLIAKGGFEIDMVWEKGRLTNLKVKASIDNDLNLDYGGCEFSKHLTKNEIIVLNDKLEQI